MQIEACPPIAKSPGPGFQIVTGTFHHQAAKTLDIGVEGESKPIGTTPNHPFWSVDRQAFVRADSLTVGERLQNLNGITTVTSISPRGPPEPVYNLEVQVKHTYFVADSGVLVHNGGIGCGADDATDFYRGGNKLKARLGVDVKKADDGLIHPLKSNGRAQGLSINIDPKDKFIQKYGGAFPIKKIPDGLQILPDGRAGHFVISPIKSMSFEQFQELLDQVLLGTFNKLL